MTRPILRTTAWRVILVVAAVLSVGWFFRFHILSHFTLFSGDSYDGMIEISILQHWDNVFHGAEAWNDLSYFKPAANSLGYNDGYLLYGMIYTAARMTGLPLVAAAEAVNVVMKLIGFGAMYAFLVRRAECRPGWALAGAVLFTVADLTLIHVNHAQLLSVALCADRWPVGVERRRCLVSWRPASPVAQRHGVRRGVRGLDQHGVLPRLVLRLFPAGDAGAPSGDRRRQSPAIRIGGQGRARQPGDHRWGGADHAGPFPVGLSQARRWRRARADFPGSGAPRSCCCGCSIRARTTDCGRAYTLG